MAQDLCRRSVISGFGAAVAGAILSDSGAHAAVDTAVSPYPKARDLINALRSRQVSSRALVNAAIARIEALDAKINAVVVRDFDRARAAAAAADEALGRGERTPLLGLPMTVKEQFGRGDLAVYGPMARSAGDLALELSVVAGPDELMEGVGYQLALPPPRRDKLADYRVLVVDEHPLCPTANSIRTALSDMADRLGKAGCTILRKSTGLPDLSLTSRVYRKLLSASYSADLPPEARARIEEAANALSPDDQSLAASGLRGVTMTHAEWIRQSRIRSGLRARWQAIFQDVDVMLCPPMPTQAFPHDHSPQYARKLDVDGTEIPYNDQSVWAGIAILTEFGGFKAPPTI